jgi:hypothetical protein
MHTCIHRTNMLTYMHAYIHACLHTYIYTYICADMRIACEWWWYTITHTQKHTTHKRIEKLRRITGYIH